MSLLATAALITCLASGQDAPGAESAVTKVLDAAVARLYDPAADGLKSLSFVVPIQEGRDNLNAMLAMSGAQLPEGTPDMVPLGEVKVDWTAGGEPRIRGSVHDDLPAALAPMKAPIQSTSTALGMQVLGAARHKLIDFGDLLRLYDGTLGASDDGDLMLTFARKADVSEEEAPSAKLTWLFDEDGLPSGVRSSVELPTPMGRMSIEEATDYHWGTPRGEDGPLVLAGVTIARKQGGVEMVRQDVTYHYEEREGVIVLISYDESITPLGMAAQMMPKVTKQIVLADLVVTSTASDAEDDEG